MRSTIEEAAPQSTPTDSENSSTKIATTINWRRALLVAFGFCAVILVASAIWIAQQRWSEQAIVRQIEDVGGKVVYASSFDSKIIFSEANQMNEGSFSSFAAFRRVVGVRLSGCEVPDSLMPQIAELKNLRSLAVCNIAARIDGLEHLASLKCLRSLDLQSTRVADREASVISLLKSVEYLNLSRTLLTDAGLSSLQEMKQLKRLRVEGTPVTAEGVKSLSHSIRGLIIDVDNAAQESVTPIISLTSL